MSSTRSWNEQKDTREKIDIVKLEAELKEIVAKEEKLRAAIDKIVAELSPTRAATCDGGTGLTPAQQNRRGK